MEGNVMPGELLVQCQSEIQLIVFRLGNEEYAVPITYVQEIIMYQTPTKIPKSPLFIEGVINLRGNIIPIIDGKKRFQLDCTKNFILLDRRIVVLDISKEIIGFVVDSVSEVIHLKAEDIESSPVEIEDRSNFIYGVGKYQDRLLILIDPHKFLTKVESESLKSLNN